MFSRPLTPLNHLNRVPRGPEVETRSRSKRNFFCVAVNGREDRMDSYAAKPIARVAPVLFVTMQDAMPKATFRSFEILGGVVSGFPIACAVQEPCLGADGRPGTRWN